MVQWVNLNRKNGFVIEHRYSALSEKAGPIKKKIPPTKKFCPG